MKKLSSICWLSVFFLLLKICLSQIYEVPCSVQQSEAYKWGTNAAFLAASIAVGVAPPVTILRPPGAGAAVGAAAANLLRFLWPMIIGANDKCVSDAIKDTMKKVESLTNQKVNNLTVEEIRRWFDGHTDTARKVYEWIPLIKNAKDETTRRDASLEFLKALHYLYYSANEARDSFIEGAIGQAASFLFIRELALLQFNVASEIVASAYTPEIVKRKFLDNYREDVEYYWRTGHLSVEKMVKCLPNAEIGRARAGLAVHLRPMFEFAYKFIQQSSKNASDVYSRRAVYKPVTSGDFVAFRLDNARLAVFESIFRVPLRPNQTGAVAACPVSYCGWDPFDDRFSPISSRNHQTLGYPCRDSIFDIIATTQPLGTPISTCEIVSVNFRLPAGLLVQNAPPPAPSLAVLLRNNNSTSEVTPPLFVVGGFNETTNERLPCGHEILDRDRVLLTPTTPWLTKVNTMDAVILKAN